MAPGCTVVKARSASTWPSISPEVMSITATLSGDAERRLMLPATKSPPRVR